MKNGIKIRNDGKKERSKEDKDFEQIHVYQVRKIRQNARNRSDTRVKYRDQAYRESTPNGESDKNIVLGKRIDFGPFIG